MKKLRVRNFDKFQHYHNRNITAWIKIYFSILDDYQFQKLDYKTRWVFIGFILLAGKHRNEIPYDIDFISRAIAFDTALPEAIKHLVSINFLEEFSDDKPIDILSSIDNVYTTSIPIREDKSRRDKKRVDKICAPAAQTSPPKEPRKVFAIPTIEEVRQYVKDKGYNVDAEKWWHFYAAKDWKIGKNKMVNWKSAVVTWHKSEKQPNKLTPPPGKYDGIGEEFNV